VSDDRDPVVTLGAFQISPEWLSFPASPTTQAKVALWLLRGSQKRCGHLGEYASGSCAMGRVEGDRRARLAARLLASMVVEPREEPRFKRAW
jgi:hypothetical protein